MDDSSASPTVGPDGDVYYGYGVFESSCCTNDDRGWLLHFDAALTNIKTPGAFGWDTTASVVPASLVPSYRGASSYLLFTKYNNYLGIGGNGQNKIAVLDPNGTEIDPITGATVMQEVITMLGPTLDPPGNTSGSVREWCINSAAIDPFAASAIANSEDGVVYRWDFASNSFIQQVRLTAGVGEAYTPTAIGADGTAYAINDASLFAVGQASNLTIASSHTGSFIEGESGAVYTLTVTNSGSGATNGSVTVIDRLPASLTATSIAGSGWACAQPAGPCTRSDALPAGASYPAITLTVNVAANAPSTVTNMATVSSDGAVNSVNATAGDVTNILIPGPPVLSIAKTHSGNFTQGQNGAYTVTISNPAGAGATNGPVTMTETAPQGMVLLAMSGTGWTCASNVCNRSDALNGGATYPVITVTVNVGAAASSPQVNSVSVSGGGSASASATDSTIIQAASGTGPAPVSVTPNSGTGAQQTFALQYADPVGAADLTTVWVWITSNFNPASPANSCLAHYNSATNQLFLFNDAGTAELSPVTLGGAGTLSNSQCSIGVAAATVSTSGNNLTLNLPVTFTTAYAGAKTTYMYAAGSTAASGWQATGSWTVPGTAAAVTTVSVTPSSGSGLAPTFALVYGDTLGTADLTSVWVWITSNFNPAAPANSCLAHYSPATNQLFLFNDAGTAELSPVTLGGAGTLSNSQCSIGVAAATVSTSGNNLTLNLPVTFTAAYAGAKSTYMYAAGSSAASGWVATGTWTVPATVATVTTVSVTPSSGSGLAPTFALEYADTLGTADLTTVWVWVTSNFNPASPANSCLLYYVRATNEVFLFNDAGTAALAPATLGGAGTLSNSQCSIGVAAATVSTSGNNLTVNLPVTFTAAYAGAKSTYMYAAGASAASGWVAMGTWTVPGTVATVTTVSVLPSSGSGLAPTFALEYADTLGTADLTTVWVWITSNFNPASPSSSCLAYYNRATNQLSLFNDAGTGALAPATLGGAGTLSNSQCSIGVAAATVSTSGNNLTLNLPVTFTAAYAGAKTTYLYAAGSSAASGWQSMGTWTVP
jgi:uncharacterized repeat protein (TIGR01451 family)